MQTGSYYVSLFRAVIDEQKVAAAADGDVASDAAAVAAAGFVAAVAVDAAAAAVVAPFPLPKKNCYSSA